MKPRSLARLLLSTTLLATAPPAWAAGRPFAPRDAIELSSFVQPTADEESFPRPAPIVSPDGRWFLMVTERGVLASNRLESTLWLFDRQAVDDWARKKTAAPPPPRVLATVSATSNRTVLCGVRWLDAERVAFLGKDGSPFQRLWVADVQSGKVTPWTPDDRFVSAYDIRGDTVAYTTLIPPSRKDLGGDLVAVGDRSFYSLLYRDPPALADLDGDALGAQAVALHVARGGVELPLAFTWQGKPLRLFASAWSSAPPLALSPDSSSLLTLAPVLAIPAAWSAYRPGPDAENAPLRPGDPHAVAEDNFYKPLQFVRVDLKTGAVIPLLDAPAARGLGYIVPTRGYWRADGRQALLVNTFLPLTGSAAERKERAEGPVVAAVDTATGHLEVLTRLHLPRYQEANFYRVQDVTWNAQEDTLTLTYVATAARRAPAPEIYRRRSGRWEKAPAPSLTAAREAQSETEIQVEESFDRSPVLTARRRGDPTAAVLWDPDPQLAEIAMGKVTLYSWKDRGGRTWSGLLAFPPDFAPGKRYPLVIQTHGYSKDRFFTDGVYTTGSAGRSLAARGFLVLQMEMPGEHLFTPEDGPFELGGFEAVVAQLDREGRIDPRRVGVIGFSYTCFHTLYALVHHPDLFAAAAITDGNNMSYTQYVYSEEDWQRTVETTNGGVPWGPNGETWWKRAPDFHLDQVRTPLLISALERGELLALWEPYAGLRRLGRPVDLLWLQKEDATHVLVKPRHRELSTQSAVDWFELWLNGREDPDPGKAEQYARWRRLRGQAVPASSSPASSDLGPAGKGNEPPRPLSARGKLNLLAYLHLLGVLRYFHPGDQAASLDWERFVIATVDEVEAAPSPAELAQTLSRIFAPVAPTARFFVTGQVPPRSPVPKSAEAKVVAWVHHGLETSADRSHAHFSSRRVGGYLSEPPTESVDLPTPEEPAELDLGGGVAARVPVALYRDAGGTLPHQDRAPDPFQQKKPKGFEPSGDDRATRLADVLLLGAALENFYPYPDGRARFREQIPGALAAAAEDPDARRFLDTLRRLAHALGDGHAEAAHGLDARRFRIPLLWTSIGDSLVVTWVAPEITEVRPGDVVLAVDGRPASAAVAAAESLVSAASAGHLRLLALEFLASGDREEERRLRIARGGRTFEVSLRCSANTFGSQRPRQPRPGAIAEVAPGLWFLDVERIDDKGFASALPQLEKANGIVFDLRGYPARVSPVLLLGRLLDGPAVIKTCTEARTRPDRPGRLEVKETLLKPAGEKLRARIVFLTDEWAVSLAEAFLQVVDDHHLATIVGGPTAGTQGEIDEMILPGAYHVRWTGSRVLRADGTPYRGVGVVPSLLVQPTLAGIAAQRDEVLETAVAYLTRASAAP